jgi:hypothetical protein
MRTTLLLLAAMASFVSTLAAQEHRFGAGLMLGEPTGPSLKYFLNENNAIDAGIGWSFANNDDLHIHSDYLWHNYDWLRDVADGRLPVYYGVGGRVKFGSDTRVGVRGPIGISYMLEDIPVEVFGEVGPVLDFTPGLRLGFTAAIGARFWF